MPPSRRRLLAALGAVASLTGCSGLDGGRPTGTGSSTGTLTPSDTTRPTDIPTDPPEPTDSPTPAPPSHPGASWAGYQGDAANTGHVDVLGPSQPGVAWERGDARPVPVLSGNRIVIAGSNHVYALSADGSERWATRLTEEVTDSLAREYYVTAVALADDRILATVTDGRVVALALDDGAELWTGSLPDEVVNPPAVAGDTAYVTAGGRLFALATADGAEQWQRQLGTALTAPAVHEGAVYLGVSRHGGRAVVSVTPDGHDRWERNVVDGELTTPAVGGGAVHTVAGTDQPPMRAYALSVDDGVTDWAADHVGATDGPAVADSMAYLGQGTGTVRAYGPDGAERWMTTAPHDRVRAPVVAGRERVYVGGDGGEHGFVRALARSDGDEVWRRSMPRTVRGLALADGALYVGMRGRLRALTDP